MEVGLVSVLVPGEALPGLVHCGQAARVAGPRVLKLSLATLTAVHSRPSESADPQVGFRSYNYFPVNIHCFICNLLAPTSKLC